MEYTAKDIKTLSPDVDVDIDILLVLMEQVRRGDAIIFATIDEFGRKLRGVPEGSVEYDAIVEMLFEAGWSYIEQHAIVDEFRRRLSAAGHISRLD